MKLQTLRNMEKAILSLQRSVEVETSKRDKAIANISALENEIDATNNAAKILTGGLSVAEALHPVQEELPIQLPKVEGNLTVDGDAVADMSPILKDDPFNFDNN